jgi:hypothetical protein
MTTATAVPTARSGRRPSARRKALSGMSAPSRRRWNEASGSIRRRAVSPSKHGRTTGSGTVVHLRPSTKRIYESNLRLHVLPELGQIELGKLTPPMLRAWLAGLSSKTGGHGKPVSPGLAAQVYRTLNRVLAAAVDDELLGRNPLSPIKPPRSATQEMRFITHDDVATLVAAVDERYRAMVFVAAYGGLRAGELIALKRRHVDLLHGTVTVVEQVRSSTAASPFRRPRARPAVAPSRCPASSSRRSRHTSVPQSTLDPTASSSRALRAVTSGSRTPPAGLAASGAPRRPAAASLPRSPPHVRVPGHSRGRRRQGAPANARPRVSGAHPRPLRTPAPGTSRTGRAAVRQRRSARSPCDRPQTRPARCGRGILAGWTRDAKTPPHSPSPLRWSFVVVGTGVDPVTPRFSGACSAN